MAAICLIVICLFGLCIVERIEKRLDSMKSEAEFADVLQQRARLIAEHAQFRNDDDVVPAPESVATVYAINANGAIREKDVGLLGTNYFGIANAVSR